MTGADEPRSASAGEATADAGKRETSDVVPTGEPPSEVREALADRLAERGALLLALDFDGTLAEIVDDPDAAAPREGNRGLLRRLRGDPRVALAVVSGRDLRDVRERVGVDGLVYAGNHGMELARGGDDPAAHPTVERHADAIERVSDRLRRRFADADGVRVEDKGETATVHYRHAPEERTDEIEDAVAAVVDEADRDLQVTDGKQIVELRPPVDWDKGRMVELLDDSRGDCLTVYFGDDETDEAAFRAIQPEGVGVLVGDRESEAALRVDDPEAVTALLSWLVEEGLDALGADRRDEGDSDADGSQRERRDAGEWDLPGWA